MVPSLSECQQAALRESEARFRSILDHSLDCLYRLNLQTRRYEYMSPAIEGLVGYTAAEVMALSPEAAFAMVHPDDLPAMRAAWAQAEQVGVVRTKYRQRHKNGGYRWLLNSVSVIRDPAGRPLYRDGSVRDITDHRQVEQEALEQERALRESEARFRSVLDNSTDAVYRLNLATGRYDYFSPASKAVYGKTPDEMAAMSPDEILECVHPDDRDEVSSALERLGEEGASVVEFRWRNDDQGYRWLSASMNLWRDANGKPLYRDGFVRNVSVRKLAEEGLARSQSTLSELIERAPFGIYVVDSQFCIAQMNAGSQTGAFRNVRPVIGRDFSEAMHILWTDDVAEGIIARFRHTLDTGEPYLSPRFVNPRHDVPIVESYEWELHRLTLPDGQYGVICYYFDSTLLRDAEESLRQTQKRLVLAQESAGAGFWGWNVETGHLDWAPELFRMFGLDPAVDQANFDVWREVLHPDDRQVAEEQIEVALRDRVRLRSEYRVVWPTGEARWIQATGDTTYDAAGKATYMLGLCIDITERKQADEALRASERLLTTAVDLLPVGLWVLDAKGQIVISSAAAQRIWAGVHYVGLDQLGEYKGWRTADGTLVEAHDWAGARALEKGETTLDQEVEIECFDGTRKIILDSAVPLRESDGTIRGAVTVNQDITERKNTENALRQINDSLEQRVSERTAEARHLADQLRALASELSQTEQRERKRLAAILHDHLQQLLVAAHMHLDMVKRADQATAAAAIQGVQSILKEAIDASRSLTVELSPPILEQAGLAAALGWLAARMQEKHHFQVHVQADYDAAPTDERTRVLLFESVRELLLNAAKHSGVQEANVTLMRTAQGWTRVVVEDGGRGLDPAEVQSRVAEGGSFGLFSIQQRITYLGGRMAIESTLGTGTRVILETPPEQAEPAVQPMAEAAAPGTGLQAVRFHERGARISVVLVDDHRIMRQGLVRILQLEADIDVVAEAEDGQKAVELARLHKPDAIVMDVNMPSMNGIEATRIIMQELPQTRIIGLSMHLDADVATAMRKAGAVGFLTKGGPSEDLVAAIRACRVA
jgi:PAS domain S-box-containing protein